MKNMLLIGLMLVSCVSFAKVEELIPGKDADQLKDVAEKGQNIVIDISASWCLPCQLLEPMFEKASESLKDKAVFFHADVDKFPGLFEKLGGVPVVMVINTKAQQVRGLNGLPDSQDQLENAIKNILK